MATRILMMTCWQENGMKVKGHLYFMHDVMTVSYTHLDVYKRQGWIVFPGKGRCQTFQIHPDDVTFGVVVKIGVLHLSLIHI